jgi:hypothetical protein
MIDDLFAFGLQQEEQVNRAMAQAAAPAPSGIPQVQLVGTPRSVRRIKFQPESCKLPPQIRLSGQWLVAAGFIPGERVEVAVTGAGELVIRRPQPVDLEQARQSALARIDAAMSATEARV